MAQDAQSEFERIFGKTQRENENKAPASNPSSGVTRKLPSDSDLLGIRTDSDRFIAKKDIPETLPAEGSQKKPGVDPEAKTTAQDAMTIALNVNVFANIADAKKPGGAGGDKNQITGTVSELLGKKPGEVAGASAEGATFVIPLPKDPGKSGDAPKSGAGASKSSIADEFTRILSPKNIPAGPASNTEFTRVLHVEDSIKVPKPPTAGEAPPASTISITSDPKLPANLPPEPTVVTPSGPSAFTKVVKGSELRTLQEKLAAAAGHQQAAWQPPAPNPVGGPAGTQPWQSASAAPVPQYIPAPGSQWSGSPQSPAMPSQAPQPSKLSQYMPLIIVLNLLVLMAILLIFFFAIKK